MAKKITKFEKRLMQSARAKARNFKQPTAKRHKAYQERRGGKFGAASPVRVLVKDGKPVGE